MKYKVLYDNPSESLLQRLFKIRNIDDTPENFLNPSFSTYRQDPYQLNDIEKALDRICLAIRQKEKIMIFGDYDVDGIVSTYVMYTFFRTFLGYENISLRLPHKLNDGYGIKSYHLDEIAKSGASLVITVDNGITAVEEALHAKKLGIDFLITDHHHALEKIPEAPAIVNPQVSPKFDFKEICGAAVAFKVCMALADRLFEDRSKTKKMYTTMLPFVAIATVADCMPLVNENRLIVKKGLELMNKQRRHLAPSLQTMLDYLNIKEVSTFHIGFMIAPRLNATGRMDSAVEGLKSLLYTDRGLLTQQLERMDELNTIRKKTQDEMLKHANAEIDPNHNILIAASEDYHEGIVGIVAGRITEQFHKPSLIMGIDSEKGIATGSLRGPTYFNIVEMLQSADELLERYGGHEQAGGLTVRLENLDKLANHLVQYCEACISDDDLEKEVTIDTKIYTKDFEDNMLEVVDELGPYGQGNHEPNFLLEDIVITDAELVGKKERKHLKLQAKKSHHGFSIMQRGKGDLIDKIPRNEELHLIGKLKKDTFNGGFFVDAKTFVGQDID